MADTVADMVANTGRDPATHPRAVMADWLILHGAQAAECLARLDQIHIPPHRPCPDPAFPKVEVLPRVLSALRQALPDAAAVIDTIQTRVRIDLAPDRSRFPRAFTLHDAGQGLPAVSCPLRGRLSDLLVLAHEIGHVCQILGNGPDSIPPVLRETAAYVAERIMLGGGAPDPALTMLHSLRTRRIMQRHGTALRLALQNPAAAYDYGWNYPLARDLAARAMTQLPGHEVWQVFGGAQSLARLWQLGPLYQRTH